MVQHRLQPYSKVFNMNYKHSLFSIGIFIFIILIGIALFYIFGKSIWYPYYEKLYIERDVKPVVPVECKECLECRKKHLDINLSKWSPLPYIIPKEKISTKQRLNRHLGNGGFVFYPKKLTLIGMKYERKLEVWGELNGKWSMIGLYSFTGFSGRLGPKIEEGDRQIPEGIYKISYLNPNSKFHLSLRVNYPNAFDKKIAKKEKRTGLGGDIMIHGSNVTIGCIPIGDESIEELYMLAEKVGIANIKVILAPVDFRKMNVNIKEDKHPWLRELYDEITKEMKEFILK